MDTKFASLRFKISLFIIILLVVTAALFTALTIQVMNRQILREVMKRAETVGQSMASSAAFSVLDGDVLAMDNLGWRVKQANGDVEFAAVTDTAFRVLTHTDLNRTGSTLDLASLEEIAVTPSGAKIYRDGSSDPSFQVVVPMYFNGKQIGNSVVKVNNFAMKQARAETLKHVLMGLIAAVVLGVGCILILSSFITRPIKQLSRGVEELKLGVRPKLAVNSRDELGRLTASFNHLSDLTTRQQDRLRSYAQQIEDAYLSTIKVLTAAIDARDTSTLGHSTRVAKLATRIGEAIGLSKKELEDLEVASLFHDVGKLKTPDGVLLKDGPLDEHEHQQITNHCEHGAAILSRANSLHKYIPAVRHHHEWYNGEGYPDGLRGDDIPLHASIIAVADAFDAMTSVRPYKRSFSRKDALQELSRFSGTQFNPWLVDVFQTTLETDPLLAEQFSGSR